jgi:iron-sulfur cluster repair protein YtfE (RIC family)
MEFRRHVSRALHEDHLATLALLQRLERLLGHHGPSQPPAKEDAQTSRLLKELLRALEGETVTHFAFEEDSVFPVLAEAGESEMGDYLTEEHRVILDLARRLIDIARPALEAGFTGTAWSAFHDAGAALVEHLAAHVQKEEGGLLPALDELLDDETDGRLAIDFAGRR